MILNVELDHVDYFDGIESIKSSFRKYVETPRPGEKVNRALVNLDCQNSVDAVCGASADINYYSIRSDADFCAKNIIYNHGYGVFDLYHKGDCVIESVKLSVPGEHNVSNAVAACAAALLTGIPPEYVKKGIESFCGVARRFEKKGEFHGATLIDDYAHHPDEISVTLNTAKKLGYERVICVFQPHTYSRTKALMNDFAKTLAIADKVFLAEIYPARETNIYNISSKDLAKLIDGCEYYESFGQISDVLRNFIKAGDLVITMGAGEAYKVADALLSDI